MKDQHYILTDQSDLGGIGILAGPFDDEDAETAYLIQHLPAIYNESGGHEPTLAFLDVHADGTVEVGPFANGYLESLLSEVPA